MWQDNRKRESLPIDGYLDKITELLVSAKVVICEAGTGAGKSTRIPQALLLNFPDKKILMTQPRRNACRWIGARIASELGVTPGKLVAWRLRNDTLKYKLEDIRLEVLVDQSLVNQIRKQQRLPEGIIIIDEAHERSISIDLLLGLIKEKLADSPKTHVLITSATVDTQKFSEFFDNAPIISVEGRCFPVSTRTMSLTNREHHTEGAIRAAKYVIEEFMQNCLTVPSDTKEKEQTLSKGTVIVLLPGKEDITIVKKELESSTQSSNSEKQIEVLTCHGESTLAEQNKIQEKVPDNTLRLICSTEILRSSVTVPDTIGVIDSLQIKRMIVNENGVRELKKILVSKAEAEQAKGRAGRTAPGFYIAVESHNEYENLEAWPIPAILRESITCVALQIAAVEHNMRNFALIDKPAPEKVSNAIEKLKHISALTEKELITEEGRLLLEFPVEPELAVTLLYADKLNILAETIIVIAALQEGDFFQKSKKDTKIMANSPLLELIKSHDALPQMCIKFHGNDLYQIDCGHPEFPKSEGARWISQLVKQTWAGNSNSDFIVIVNAYRAFKAEEHAFKNKTPHYKYQKLSQLHFRNWCEARGLNYKRMQIIDERIQEILEAVSLSPLKLQDRCDKKRDFDETALTKAIASGKVDSIVFGSVFYWRARKTFSGRIGDECQLDFSSACSQDNEFILAGNIRKIHKPSRGQIQYDLLISVAAKIEPDWLIEIAPALCKEKLLTDYYYEIQDDCVKQTHISLFDDKYQLASKKVIVADALIVRKYLEDFEYKTDRDEILETEVIFVQELEIFRRKVITQNKYALAKWLARLCSSDQKINLLTPDLLNFIEQTRECNQLAHKLNARALKNIIQHYSQNDMFLYFRSILASKQHFQQVTSSEWEKLQLPELCLKDIQLQLEQYPDEITLLNKNFKINYPEEANPFVELNLIDFNEVGLFEFIKTPLLLTDGQQIVIHVKLRIENTFSIFWQGQHADLSQCSDLSTINLLKVQSLTTYLPSEETCQHLPYFLRPTDLENTDTLQKALERLNLMRLVLNKLQFVQWSVVIQVINFARENSSVELLLLLKREPFITRTDPVSNIADSVSSWFNFFRPPNQENRGTGLIEYIEQAINQISQPESRNQVGM